MRTKFSKLKYVNLAEARRNGWDYVTSVACPNCKQSAVLLSHKENDELGLGCPNCGYRMAGMSREFNHIIDREMDAAEKQLDRAKDVNSLLYRSYKRQWDLLASVTFTE